MVRKISPSVEKKVLEQWLQGQTYRKIASECGVGLGTVNRVVDEARGKEPDLDSLREMNLAVKKSGFSLLDVLGSLPFLTKLRELEVSPNRLSIYNEVVEKIAREKGVEPSVFLQASMKVLEWEREGESAEKVLRRAERAKTEISKLEREIEEKKTKLEALRGKLELATDLSDLKTKIRKAQEEFDVLAGRLKIAKYLSSRVQSFRCPRCGTITQRNLSALEAYRLLLTGRPLTISCQACGYPALYNVIQILVNIALQALL